MKWSSILESIKLLIYHESQKLKWNLDEVCLHKMLIK